MRRIALSLLLALTAMAEEKTLTIYVSPEHPYSLAYNPSVWKSEDSDQEDIDLLLTHRSGTVYAALYALTGAATLDDLRGYALKNGKALAPDLKVVSEARTKKDGAELLTLQMRGTSADGPVTYRGVYWAGAEQVLQLVATSTRETDADVQELLDGLSIRLPKTEKRAFTMEFAPLKWRVTDDGSKDGTMMFQHDAGDTMAIVSAARADIPPGGLRDYVLTQARALAPDARVVGEEAKSVAGVKVTMMQLEGTSEGVAAVMLGYFLGGAGTYVQAVTFTPRERFPQRKADMLELLDGLRIHLPRE